MIKMMSCIVEFSASRVSVNMYRTAARAIGNDIPVRSISQAESSEFPLRTIPRWTASRNTRSTASEHSALERVAIQSVTVIMSGVATCLAVAIADVGDDRFPQISSHSSSDY